MAVMPVMPRDPGEWTLADLEHLPDDGNRYELLDGNLLVSPAPVKQHQWAVSRLFLALEAARPPHLKVFFAPLDWRPGGRNALQPDLLVIPADDSGVKYVTGPLLLAVEVLSPSTQSRDLLDKRSKYERSGVTSYWIVDPDPEKPRVLVHELRDGRYAEAAQVVGDEEIALDLPFPIIISPSALVE